MSVFLALAEILFVGDGRLERDLPGLVQAGLLAMGGTLSVATDFIDGGALQYNLDTPTQPYPNASPPIVEAISELKKGETRALILSEATPLDKILRWHDPVDALATYAAIARAANPDTRVFYTETWQSLNSGTGPATEQDPAFDIPWRERIATEGDIWRAITAKASEDPLGGPVEMIPVGRAMGRLADEIAAGNVPGISSINELFQDELSPNGRGMYFVAMVELATLTGKSPEGLPARLLRTWPSKEWVITDEQAAVFQRIAWEEVQAFRDLPPVQPVSLSGAAPQPQAEATEVAATPEVKEIPVAPVPDVIDLPSVTNPSLFVGLAPVVDWSTSVPFLNLMKTARPWVGHVKGNWGGWEHDDLVKAGALDENGWPKRIPEGLGGLSTLVLTEMPRDALGLRGRYVVRYDGTATLAFEGSGTIVSNEPGRLLFDYEPSASAVILTIREMDETDPLRNMTIVREDRVAAFDQGQIFNPDWLARLRGVEGLRFMDWMQANNSRQQRFADRPKPADYTWTRQGVPLEIMIALCNELKADPWFNIPHLADDDYVRQFAQMAHDALEPGRKTWVEFSNEVWNWQFQQAQWAEDQGRARWGEEYKWVDFYALRASEVVAIWTDVYGADADKQLVRVIGTHPGYLGIEPQILDSPMVRGEGKPAPAKSFDAYAITGYFSGGLGSEKKVATIREWVVESVAAAELAAESQGLTGDEAAAYVAAHRFDEAMPKVAQELRDGSLTGDDEDTLVRNTDHDFPYQADVAAKHGLKLVMYEGGSHVVGLGDAIDDTLLTEFFMALNYSPAMGEMYQDLLKGWAKVSDQPFNHYVDVGAPGKWGSWGAMRHLGDDNARWRALATGCDGC